MREPQFGQNAGYLEKLYLVKSGPNLKFHGKVPHNVLYQIAQKVMFCLTKCLQELKNRNIFQQNFLC